MKAREDYNTLLNSGMFFEFHPQLTGMWEKDRLEWLTIQGVLNENSTMVDKLIAIHNTMTDEEIRDEWKVISYDCRKAIRDAQYTRVLHYIVNLSPSLLESEFERFLKWERKWEEFQYDFRHKQTSSILFDVLIDIIEENYGNILFISKDDDFVSNRFEANNYIFTSFGQGAFWRIEKDGKEIFQNM